VAYSGLSRHALLLRKQTVVEKSRKMIKDLFWVYSHKHKEVRKRKETKTLTKYDRDLYVEP
jgi:hypothetical protein